MDAQRIKVVLVDDDAYALEVLSALLAPRAELQIAGSYTSAEKALSALERDRPDLLFLDIRMPGMSGFDLLDKLGDAAPEVIFVTLYDEYAIRAIRYSALDYLLKPVKAEELNAAIARFISRKESVRNALRLSNLRHNLGSNEEDLSLVFATRTGDRQFRIREIVRCEADSNYTRIYLTGGGKFLASKTLSDVEQMLMPDAFIRIHKSHIINKTHVNGITSDDAVLMSDLSKISISRRRLAEVKSILRRTG
jgi:two-component system, LytTR family, response regulator